MSSRANPSATNTTGKPKLVPKLRFPAFRGAEAWHTGPLKDSLSSISNGLALEQGGGTSGYRVTRIETISDGRIDLAKVGLIQTSEDMTAYRLRVGDILLSNINSVAHIGKSVFVDRDYDLYHGMNLLRLEVNGNQHDPKFIFYAINTDGIRASLRERANKAVNQASINQTELGKTVVVLPLIPEQQKIAECLSSVDELIGAQARKVDALKAHKKGLMQQLFPREGETQPRLRFPEFRKTGEWEPKTLVDACRMQAGKFVAAADIKELNAVGMFPCYGGNGLRGFTATHTHDGVYPLIGRQGALCGNVKLATGRFHATEHAVVATPKRGVEVVWLYYLLDLLNLNRFATGQAQPGLSVDVLEEVPVTIPSDEREQHRIASCLSSLDALITAATQKLEALKTHKRGLMQQLFPSPVATGATRVSPLRPEAVEA
jgi:type I restriction enzyme S subunit